MAPACPSMLPGMPPQTKLPPPPPPRSLECLDTRGLATILPLAEVTLKIMRAKGEGPPWIKVGRRVLYRVSEVRAWLDAQPGGGWVAPPGREP